MRPNIYNTAMCLGFGHIAQVAGKYREIECRMKAILSVVHRHISAVFLHPENRRSSSRYSQRETVDEFETGGNVSA